MSARVALATCSDPTHADEAALEHALDHLGVEWCWAQWDDPEVGWSSFDAVLVRTTWDYHHQPEAFARWIAMVGSITRVWNPPSVLTWNAHKGYLLDLVAAGVSVVPTAVLVRGQEVPDAPPDAVRVGLGLDGDADVVVKPAVSGGSKDTVRGPWGHDHVQSTLGMLLTHGDALVQPYVGAIATEGERSLIVIDGVPTHQIRKVPAVGDFRVQPQFGAGHVLEAPGTGEVALATHAMAAAATRLGVAVEDLLYARVDSVRVDGEPVLMELELIEPDLGFGLFPDAAAALARAVIARSQ